MSSNTQRRQPAKLHSCIVIAGLCASALLVASGAYAVQPPPPQCPGCLSPTDEIQVYDASIVDPGKFNLVWHSNFAPEAQPYPDYPGGVVPEHTLDGVPEWAYGVTDWWEMGAYVPIYSYTARGQLLFEGVKLRSLFVVPHADSRTFFYGINFEYSYNRPRWESYQFSGEMRGIVGTHLGPWDLILNPVVDTDFNGFKNLSFAPEARVAYNFTKKFALSAEWYSEFGAIPQFLTPSEQGQYLFGVVDIGSGAHGIEFGIGRGLTPGSTGTILKLMFMQDL